MILAHRIRLDPTVKQRIYFAKACGTARFVWNWALAEWTAQVASGESPSGTSLKRQFNETKYDQFPWLKGIHRDAHAEPFSNLDRAFRKFRLGQSRVPKFRKKGLRDSFYIANDKFIVREDKVRIPKIGWVNLREPLRFVGKIMAATVSRVADKWFIAIKVDIGEYQKPRTGNEVVGVDLGITSAAALSTGEKIEGPRPLRAAFRRLQRLSKQHSRKQKGSNNRRKSTMRLARLHARISNVRNDFLHKLTTRLASENQAVCFESLAVQNLQKNRRLARSISDMGWWEFRRQAEYKATIYGGEAIAVDRWFPSSKTCNRCSVVKESLALSDRQFVCDACGHTDDRDVNAAKNLRRAGYARSYAWGDGSAGRGNMTKLPSLNQELKREQSQLRKQARDGKA